MEAHRILVISDTHGLLRPEVLERAAGCEAILHAGDFDRPEILERLKSLAPVYAVRGNADGEWAESLPEELELELFGFRFYLIHNKKLRRKDLSGIDMMICGHSHEYQDIWEKKAGIRCLNPGSCGPKRFRLPVTMMELTLYPKEHRWEALRLEAESQASNGANRSGSPAAAGPEGESPETVRRNHMESQAANGRQSAAEPVEKDLYRLVKKVMKGMRAGKSIPDMAERCHADEGLVEEICRMYATHPGVEADGIMDRLERRGL